MKPEDLEEHYFNDARKLSKEEKKRAIAKDRSKYKKSDQKKLSQEADKRPDGDHYLRGRVLSILSEGIVVDSDGANFLCTLRGTLKQEKGLAKNLITVGDFVLFEKSHGEEGAICYVEPRRSFLSRADNLSRRKEQLIAANIDQVLITASVVNPPLKPFLIDRYIIAAKKGRMIPIVIVNKVDLLDESEEERAITQELLNAYKKTSVTTLLISAATGEGIDELKALMKDKASVFSGQSGTGKSSLINAVTGNRLAVGKTVSHTRKGAHTTTTATLLRLECGGFCIDTPGIKSFGVWDLTAEEVESYYEEIHTIGKACHFSNCSHSHEEHCAVKEALLEGTISPLRYDSYLALLESVEQEHKRR